MKRLAIITTHPIQYYAPVFKLLAAQISLKVFYTWGETSIQKYDPGFKTNIAWDIPTLDGYNYEFLENIATDPGSHHRYGIINPTLIDKVNELKPDVILIYGWAYHSHLQAMRYFKGKIPVWFRGDSTLLDEQMGLKSLFKLLYLKWIYSNIDQAFYVGQNNKAYFKRFGIKEKQLIFAPHATDNERFGMDRSKEAEALRMELGIADNELLLLFAGKLEPKKDPEILLNAFAAIQKDFIVENPDHKFLTHLLIVGNGILQYQLKSKVEELKIKNVHFMDFINQSKMPVIYQACNLFCLPSKGPSETWGLAINEAMAAGKAIIASDKVGCAIDLIADYENGFIFKNGDFFELKRKLQTMLNRDVLSEMGKVSKIMIEEWSFKVQAAAIVKSLNQISG